jgi:hypothetical protein
MDSVYRGRRTAEVPDGTVTFLIGMRINHLHRVDRWLPVAIAMPRMLAELRRKPSLGMVGRPRTFVSGRVIMVVQYWKSFDLLQEYARSRDQTHLPAWRAFNRRIKDNGSVGVFHETYLLASDTVETIYVNMPEIGLLSATAAASPSDRGQTAAARLGRDDEEGPPVDPY